MTTPALRNLPGIAPNRLPVSAPQPRLPPQPTPLAAPLRVKAAQARDTFETGKTGLAAINATPLVEGDKAHTCVTTVRKNLRSAGMKGLPDGTSADGNNPRGMMVQMLKSGRWASQPIPGSTLQTIHSKKADGSAPAYGSAPAHVLTGEAYREAARKGQIPEGSVVFQTRTGWDFDKESKGSDVGIVRNGGIFNYKQFEGMTVYKDVTSVVVLQPRGQ